MSATKSLIVSVCTRALSAFSPVFLISMVQFKCIWIVPWTVSHSPVVYELCVENKRSRNVFRGKIKRGSLSFFYGWPTKASKVQHILKNQYILLYYCWRLLFLCENKGAPERHPRPLKKFNADSFFTKRTVLYEKRVFYRYKTQNPPSQSALWSLFDYLMNTYANSAITSPAFIKKGMD